MAFYQEFSQLLANLRLKYPRKQKTFDLLAYRYGLPLPASQPLSSSASPSKLSPSKPSSSKSTSPKASPSKPTSPKPSACPRTLQAIGELPAVSLTRERVRQIINNGQDILPINFVSYTRNLLAALFSAHCFAPPPALVLPSSQSPSHPSPSPPASQLHRWTDFQTILALPYFHGLPDPLILSHWLSDLGYGRWKHQGSLYFYDPACPLAEVQKEICQANKQARHQKSVSYRSRLVGSAIKFPLRDKTRYWELKRRSGHSLTDLYHTALRQAIASPRLVLPLSACPLSPADIQVGLRIDRSLMNQLKAIAAQEGMGITIFIRQALLSYLRTQLPGV